MCEIGAKNLRLNLVFLLNVMCMCGALSREAFLRPSSDLSRPSFSLFLCYLYLMSGAAQGF